MKIETLIILGVIGYLFLRSSTKLNVPTSSPKPTTPCYPTHAGLPGEWILGGPFSENANQWICNGTEDLSKDWIFPITVHADGHYYDAVGKFVS